LNSSSDSRQRALLLRCTQHQLKYTLGATCTLSFFVVVDGHVIFIASISALPGENPLKTAAEEEIYRECRPLGRMAGAPGQWTPSCSRQTGN
jgi:hypothetical protein